MEKAIVKYEGEDDQQDDESAHWSGLQKEFDIFDFTDAFTSDMIFNSREALIHWTRNIGRRNGIVIIIKKSDVTAYGRKQRIIFACERSGVYTSTYKKDEKPKRPRAIGTKKCGCPFRLKGQKLEGIDDWVLRVICGIHNHPIAQNLEGHSYAGRLNEKEANLLIDMSKSNAKPKDILHTLKRRDVDNATTMKTIYNARHRSKVVQQAGKSQMQLLMSKLAEHKYIEWHHSDPDTDCVKDLFWVHPFSIELLRAIGFVNGCHFIEVFMQPNSPMPPIASTWFKYRKPCAEGWASSYTTNIIAFRDLVDNNATQDVINLG